jgi:hypothetical protein
MSSIHEVVDSWSNVLRKIDNFQQRVTALENAPVSGGGFDFTPTVIDTFELDQGSGGVMLTEANFPNLVNIGSIHLYSITDLATVTLPLLVGAPSGMCEIYITGCTSLVSAYFGAVDLRTFSSLSFENCSSLHTIDLSRSIWGPISSPMISPPFNASGCALTEACVNAILVRAASFLPLVNNTISIDISGGTSKAPSGAGAAAYIALTDAGNSVSTN